MKLPGRLHLIIPLLIALSLPLPGQAEADVDRYFAVEPASRKTVLTGFTRARTTMKLTSRLTEQIVEIKGDTGERIGEDGVFARLDPTFTELELKKTAIEKEKLASRIKYLGKEENRFRTLFEKQSVSETKLDSLMQDLDQARLSFLELENEETRLRELLSRHLITGPAGWLIINRFAEPGEWVTTGSPLAEIGDFLKLVVPFSVSHEEYLRIKQLKNGLTIRLPEENLNVQARLHKVSPAFDPQTRKINLELLIDTALPEQRGGIRAELTIELPDPAGALLVPETGVSTRYDSHWLTRIDGEKVPVVVLGPGSAPGTLRVTSEKCRAGDQFLRSPGDLTVTPE